MRLRSFFVLAGLSVFAGGCTAIVAASLSGDQGAKPQLGGCFHLTDNACGECIASSCEDPTGSPPVSLAAVCSLAENTSSVAVSVQGCVSDPTVSNYNCNYVFIDTDGGAYASSIDTLSQAENNVRRCITDNCRPSCSACGVDVPTCGNDTVTLPEAGVCGQCIDQAMNGAGSACQSWVLQGGCVTSSSEPIAQCAIPSGQCTTADCSGLSSPDQYLTPATKGLYQCLWGQCQGSCPSP